MKFTCLSAVLFFSAITSYGVFVRAYPLHASCKIQWTFPSVSCESFSSKITTQAATWKSADNCANGGEKCLYSITSTTADEIKGTHETPVKHYVDDISFKMTKSGDGCNVEAFSTSQTWYAYLDYSTNYCNLENLMTGAGLNATQGFTESTSDDVCTQYSSRNCEKY
ncbi:hypothetical protein ACF0H5_018804 [Mactra antiquata]